MKKHALLVGVEDYRDRMISRLQFARADATALAECLRDRCGFGHVRVLADESGEDEPLLVNIITALRDISAELRSEDLFLFFFAGHGVEKDGHGYLLARDSLQAFPEHGSLSLELLRKTFEHLTASKRVLLLDACRNCPDAGRAEGDNRMGDAICRDIVAAARSKLTSGTTTALLSACRSGQRAYEWPAKGHGVFTHYILDGLDSAAWEGHELEFADLASYVARQVRHWSSNTPGLSVPQEPWYEQFGDPETIMLADRRAAQQGTAPRRGSNGSGPQGAIEPAAIEAPAEVAPEGSRILSYSETEAEAGPFHASDFGPVLISDSDWDRLSNRVRSDFEEWERAWKDGVDPWKFVAQVYVSRLDDWRKSAAVGIPEGECLLACCHFEGLGVPLDMRTAARLYQKAAAAGFAPAMVCLGLLYEYGEGMHGDPLEATMWYSRAANSGHPVGEYLLGKCYARGYGVRPDGERARYWYNRAAEHGHRGAKDVLARNDMPADDDEIPF